MAGMPSWYERRIFNPLMDRALGGALLDELRRELLSGAHGDVVEVGIGTGLNLPHYPAGVRDLKSVSPDEALDPRVERRARVCGRRVELIRGDAQALPLSDASVDTLVCTFVLCSVADPRRAATEFARVLRPEGALLVAEHTRSPRALERALQRTLTPLHRHWACGCHLDRDLAAALGAAGFDLSQASVARSPALPFPASELLAGRARLARRSG